MEAALANTLHQLLVIGLETLMLVAIALCGRFQQLAVQYFRQKTTTAEREWLRLVGGEAYHFAERAFVQHDGPAKLNEAVKYVLERAEEHGISLSYPEIRAAIETAWTNAAAVQK